MSRSNIKNNFINRDYFRKPYLVDSYKDMVKKTPLASTNDYKTKPHSEFEKPYRDITYGQMQNIHPDEYRRANFNLNLDFDIIGEESEHKKCNSHLSIGPFDPVVQCNSVQIFQPSGKPPFEFFIIQGPGEMSGNIWVGPGCPYKTSGSITGDLVIVGVIDDCSGGPAVTKGNVTYPRHTSEAHFRIDEEDGDDIWILDEEIHYCSDAVDIEITTFNNEENKVEVGIFFDYCDPVACPSPHANGCIFGSPYSDAQAYATGNWSPICDPVPAFTCWYTSYEKRYRRVSG